MKALSFLRFERFWVMFDDLFDFGKKRTLKQSVGFFLFYGGVFLLFSSLLRAFGV